MKKFGLGLLAVVVLACAITVARTGQARAATIPLGCPGSTIQGPPSPTSNYSCPGGGAVINGKYEANGVAAPTNTSANSGCPALGTPGLNVDCSGGKNPIYALLQFAINWMIRLLGVLAVLAIVVSGIQYASSGGNPEGLKAAKSRLTNAVVGLILLSLMFVILHVIGIV